MKLKLYDKRSILKMELSADDSSVVESGIQTDTLLSLSFTDHRFVIFSVDDFIDVNGCRYWILDEYKPARQSSVEWKYNVKLYSSECRAKNALVLSPDGEAVFSITSNARVIATLLIDNINRLFGSKDWKVGEVVSSDTITIDFNGTYISDALSSLADKAETEYWFDGTTLNISRCEFGTPVSLSIKNGLLSLEPTGEDASRFFTRLYPLGSTRNIDRDKYGYKRLQLPNREKYREQNVDFGIIEQFEEAAFSGIYPRYTGTVTAVREEKRTNKDGTPYWVYYFTDSSIPFDPNKYEISGLVKNISFISGNLNGCDFNVNYDSSKKEFEIITQFPSDDIQMPNDILAPSIGDRYNPFNISMPDEYYALAEKEYSDAVDSYMSKKNYDKTVYKSSTDYVNIVQRNIDFKVGMRIRLVSEHYFTDGYRDSRIIKLSRKINYPGMYDIEMGDMLIKGKMSVIEDGINDAKSYAREAMAGLPDIIRSWDATPVSDSNIMSSKTVDNNYIPSQKEGYANELIGFKKGAHFGKYVKDISGALINENGDAEMQSMKLHNFLDVPELRYNRISVFAGETWNAPGCGIIKSIDASRCYAELKLEEGELPSVEVNDLCKGWFYTSSGFQTIYFVITSVNNEIIYYSLRPGTTFHPFVGMHFVAYGNINNVHRQKSAVRTTSSTQYLSGVNDWEIVPNMIRAQFGDLTGLNINGVDMSDYSAYVCNIYMDGVLKQLAPAIESGINSIEVGGVNLVLNTCSEPMTNYWNANGWSNIPVYFDESEKSLVFSSYNGWQNNYIQFDNALYTVTISFECKIKSANNAWDIIISNSSSYARLYTINPTEEWVSYQFTINLNSDKFGIIIDNEDEESSLNEIYIRNLNVQRGNAITEYHPNIIDSNFPSFNYAQGTSDQWKTESGFSATNDNRFNTRISANGWEVGDIIDVSFEYKFDNLQLASNLLVYCQGTGDVTGWSNGFGGCDLSRYINNGNGTVNVHYRFTYSEAQSANNYFNFMIRHDGISAGSVSMRKMVVGDLSRIHWEQSQNDVDNKISDAKNSSASYNNRGLYSSDATYTGTAYQRDIVYVINESMASGKEYFKAKMVNGTFTNIGTDNTQYWESIGAQFSSVATGLLLAEEAIIENLISPNVKTAKTGKRIQVSQNSNSLEMIDESENIKLLIKGDEINSVSDFVPSSIPPTAINAKNISISRDFMSEDYKEEKVVHINGTEDVQLATFTIPTGYIGHIPQIIITPIIKMLITEDNDYNQIGQHGSVNVSVLLNDVELLRKNYNNYYSLDYAINENLYIEGFNVIEAGAYTLKMRLNYDYIADFSQLSDDNNAYATFRSKISNSTVYGVSNNITVERPSELTHFFTNGFGSKYSSDKYFVVINAEEQPIFETRYGLYGLRLSANGVEKMVDGIHWINI